MFRRWCDGQKFVIELEDVVAEHFDMSLADEGTLRSDGTNSLAEMVVLLSNEKLERD